jgi:hypothetical protein
MSQETGAPGVVRHARVGPSPRLLILCALPLAILIVAIMVDQFRRQQALLLADIESLTKEQYHNLNSLVAASNLQLSRLRMTMEDGIRYAYGLSETVAEQLRPVTVMGKVGAVQGLEWLPGAHNVANGSLYAVPDLKERPPEQRGPVDAAIRTLAAMQIDRRAGGPAARGPI